MLRLAVTTRKETFERLSDPLADRGIEVDHLRTKRRTYDLADTDADRFDVGFVYPSRLMEGAVVDVRQSIPWVNDRDAVLTSRNKAGVIATLAAAGLPVPQSILVSNPVSEATIESAIDRASLSFPIVVKPNSTTRGVGIAKVADLDSLFGVIDYLNLVHDFTATGDKSFLLQEFLADARDYRVMVVDGSYVGAVERRLSAGGSGRLPAGGLESNRWKHNVHRGADATAVQLPAEHRSIAESVAETLEIDYLGVDILETDDRIVVTETNARPTIDAETKYEPTFYDRLASLIERTATN
ncbi:MAG: ATP-grasp domain-containing protein [Halobacteriota archaeon]